MGDDEREREIDGLIERLELSGIDVDPRRCDVAALRLVAIDLLRLAEALGE